MAEIDWKQRPLRLVATLALAAGLLFPVTAQGQDLTGRFFPEKQSYLVGEPVFIDFEIFNEGTQTAWVDSRMGAPCIQPDTVEVVGAKYHGLGADTSFGCYGGVAGDCPSNPMELPGGERHIQRIFLSALYLIDHAGAYHVIARRRVPVYSSATAALVPPIPTRDFSSNFQITLIQGSEEELRIAFEPFVKEASNPQSPSQWQAIWAIDEMAPPFLEDLMLEIADKPNRVDPAALRRLNTPRAKRKLGDIAEHGADEGTRLRAIQELAKTGDRTFLPLLERIGTQSAGGERSIAIQAVGLLGGEDALSFLSSMLSTTDENAREAAARGLGLTVSRRAVPILITLLQTQQSRVLKAATQSLAELTHRSITSSPWAEDPSPNEYLQWAAWWSRNGATAPIYGTNACTQPWLLDNN